MLLFLHTDKEGGEVSGECYASFILPCIAVSDEI